MRVLHVIPTLSPLDGGPTQAALDLVRVGRAAGFHVDLAASASPGEHVAEWPTEFAPGRLLIFPRPAGPSRWQFSLALTRWVFTHARDYDLLHVHSVFSASALFSCLAALAARRPYVLMPHGALDPWSMTQSARIKRTYLLIMRPLLARAMILLATSPKEVRSMGDFGLAKRTRRVPLAVDIPAPQTRREDAPSRPPVVLFLSRLHGVKGLPVLLEAMALLRDQGRACSLSVAGDGAPEYRAQMVSQMQALGLEDRVRFLGFVTGEAKVRAFAQADIFVLPSFQESFGLAALEAMGHGLPAVVSDQVPLGLEIATYKAGEIAAVGSPEALAAAIGRLLDPARRAEAARNARALARDSYGPEAMRNALAAAYAEATNNGKRTPDQARATRPGFVGALRSLVWTALWPWRTLNCVLLCRWHALRGRPMPVTPERLLVLAPHPDDETLGCGVLLAAKVQVGAPVLVAMLTDGRHGLGGPVPPQEAAALRHVELTNALADLGLSTPPALLDCEDGRLRDLSDRERESFVERLADVLREFQPGEIALPNPWDCHRDHEAVLPLLREAMLLAGCRAKLYGYAIWTFWCLSWHWRRPVGLPLLRLDVGSYAERKRRAMARYASQMPRLPWAVRNAALATGVELYFELDSSGYPGGSHT